METSLTLFRIALALYCTSAAVYLWSVFRGRSAIARAAYPMVSAGLILHAAGILSLALHHQRVPFANLFESLVFAAWVMLALYLSITRCHRTDSLGAFTATAVSVMVGAGLTLPKEASPQLLALLDSPWSAIHMAASIAAYAGFIMAFGLATGYLLQEHMLKSKHISPLQQSLPSLDVLDSLSYRMVAFGFSMLTLGIIAGSMWARGAFGSFWHWDSKETAALVTWLIYLAYLHVRIVRGWRGRLANRLLIVGFACVVLTYLGISFLLPTYHNFGLR